jgi:DNA-binding NtrC family response regulator
MNGHRIMAIDDENIVGKMIKTVFEQDGYIVETFQNPGTALTRLKEEKFEVVITDLKMKDMDGMDVLKSIKKNWPETKVIMITAFASLDAAVEAFRRHADDFFAKPLKISDLKACVQKLLSEKSA